MRIAVLLYRGCRYAEVSDFVSVFNDQINEFDIIDASESPNGEIPTDEGIVLKVSNTINDTQHKRYNCIVVSGGNIRAAINNKEIDNFLISNYNDGAIIGGICNGVCLVAKSGLLDGKKTTHTAHKSYNAPQEVIDTLSPYFSKSIYIKKNIVTDGRLVSAKPSAKIDFTAEVAKLAGIISEKNCIKLKAYLTGSVVSSIKTEKEKNFQSGINYQIREMKIDDYDQVFDFWKTIDEFRIDESDLKENLEKYLKRNPHLSYIVYHNGKVTATIKSGHDGRRGYIYHLAVDKQYQKLGIAKKLLNLCLKEFVKQDISKCNIYILDSNKDAMSFWQHNGWKELEVKYKMLQKKIIE